MIHQQHFYPRKERKVKLMNHKLLYHWCLKVSKVFTALPAPKRKRLAQLSLGVILSKHCHQARIAESLALVRRDVKADSIERQLRRYTKDEKFDMGLFFGCWAAAVFSWLPEDEPIVLLVDETQICKGYRGMVLGVAWGRRCIQLAWRCYPGQGKKDSPRGGQVTMIGKLLAQIKDAVPKGRKVIVMADRGIGNSPGLCNKIAALGWSYQLRVTRLVKIRTEDGVVLPIDKAKPGKGWRASGTFFIKRGRVQGHVIVHWEKGCNEPWILITNDADLTGAEYAIRNWQEQAFRDYKSAGWEMEKTGIRDAERLDRFLTLLAVAHGVALALGSLAVLLGRARNLINGANGKMRAALSLFKEGLRYFHGDIKFDGEMPDLRLIPDGRW